MPGSATAQLLCSGAAERSAAETAALAARPLPLPPPRREPRLLRLLLLLLAKRSGLGSGGSVKAAFLLRTVGPSVTAAAFADGAGVAAIRSAVVDFAFGLLRIGKGAISG